MALTSASALVSSRPSVIAKGTRPETKAPTVSRTTASAEELRRAGSEGALPRTARVVSARVPFALTPDGLLARSAVLVSAKGTREIDSQRLVGMAG